MNGSSSKQLKKAALLNKELRRRLEKAVEMVQELSAEKGIVQRNLKRAGAAVMERDEVINAKDILIESLKQKINSLLTQNSKLQSESSRVKSDYAVAKEDAAQRSLEIDKLRDEFEITISDLKKSQAEELSACAMHIAGLEAQISEMRTKHPGSALLRETSQKFPDGRKKTVLRTIYEDAYSLKQQALGVSDPMNIEISSA